MKKAIYAGSFDPITNGHLWVIQQSSKLFDEVLVILAFNPNKSSYFNLNEKQNQIQAAISSFPNVKLKTVSDQYIAKVAQTEGADYLVRGIRNIQDFEYEKTIERINQKINPTLQTIYLTPPAELSEISSSMVKSLIGFPGWQTLVKTMVSDKVLSGFLRKHHQEFISKEWFNLSGKSTLTEEYLEKILDNHSQSHRYYHNLSHLVALLKHADVMIKDLKLDSVSAATIKYSIFFHDLIYNPMSKTNEVDSAAVWTEFAQKQNFMAVMEEMVKETILATASHSKSVKYPITELFLDLDLSILGSSPEVFMQYEEAIRQEYIFVPEDVYQAERAKIMKLLVNPFKTSWGKNNWDTKAKENLKKYE